MKPRSLLAITLCAILVSCGKNTVQQNPSTSDKSSNLQSVVAQKEPRAEAPTNGPAQPAGVPSIQSTMAAIRQEEATVNTYLRQPATMQVMPGVTSTWVEQSVTLSEAGLRLWEHTTDISGGRTLLDLTTSAEIALEDITPQALTVKILDGQTDFGINLILHGKSISRKSSNGAVEKTDKWLFVLSSQSDLVQCSKHLLAYIDKIQSYRKGVGKGSVLGNGN